jgi:hypothetical protein
MANWRNLSEKGVRAAKEIILHGRSDLLNFHSATRQSLCRRNILECVYINRKPYYLVSYEASSDVKRSSSSPFDKWIRRAGLDKFAHCWDIADDHVHERAAQAAANVLAGLLEDGFNFETGEIQHAHLYDIEAEWIDGLGFHQYCVIDLEDDRSTVWVDQSFDACMFWIRQQYQQQLENQEVQYAN